MVIAAIVLVFSVVQVFSGGSDISDAESAPDLTVTGSSKTYADQSFGTLTLAAGSTIGGGDFYGCTIDTVVIQGNITAKTSPGLQYFFEGADIGKVVVKSPCSKIPNNMFYGARVGVLDLSALSQNSLMISPHAFHGCSNLDSVDFTKINYINSYAFSGTAIVSADLSGLSSVGISAFASCLALESVRFSDNDFNITSNAFSGCTKLSVLENTSGVMAIGADAFSGCTSLPSELVFNNLTNFGTRAFDGCDQITSVTVPETCTFSSSSFNTMPDRIHGLREITVDGGKIFCNKTSSGYGIVYVQPTVRNVDLSGDATISSIGMDAFQNCTELVSAIFGDSVKTIDMYAFDGCRSLISVSLPGITTVPNKAFNGCIALSVCDMPGVTTIKGAAFSDCISLTSIPNEASVTSIGDNAFKNTGMTELTLKSGVTYGTYAFSACANLYSVTFVTSDSKLGLSNYLFYGSTVLDTVNGLENVSNIGNYSFYNTGFRTLQLPAGIIIGNYAFSTNSVLESVEFLGGATVGQYAFQNCQMLENISFNGPSTIADGAFYGCPTLSLAGKDGVSDLHGVTSIGAKAFYADTTITDLMLPASIVSIAAEAFEGCIYMTCLSIEDGASETHVVDNVAYSGTKILFVAQGIEEVRLGADVDGFHQEGSRSVFTVLSNLKSVIVDAENQKYHSLDGMLVEDRDGDRILVVVPRTMQIEDYTLEITDVDVIASYAFCNVDVLELVINGSVAIQADAFYECELLNNVTIHAGSGAVDVSGSMMNSSNKKLDFLSISAGDVTFVGNVKGIVNIEIDSTGTVTIPVYAFSSELHSLMINSSRNLVISNGAIANMKDLTHMRIVASDSLTVNCPMNSIARGAVIEIDVPAGSWTSDTTGIVKNYGALLYATPRSEVAGTEPIYYENGQIYHRVGALDNVFYKAEMDVIPEIAISAGAASLTVDSGCGYTMYDMVVSVNGSVVECKNGSYDFIYDPAQTYVVTIAEQTSEVRYRVTFDTGFEAKVQSFKVYSGRTLAGYDLTPPVRYGYDFAGWYLDKEFTQLYGPQCIVADTVLYAKWISKGTFLDVDESHGKFYTLSERYVPTVFDGDVSLIFVPARGYVFDGFDVTGDAVYTTDGFGITVTSVDGYARIEPLTTYVSASSDLLNTVEFDTPTASDNLVLSWSFRIDEFGGVVDQSHGAWLGMSSTPLIVDDRVYVQADGCVVCIDINTGEVVNMVSGYTSTADFYHYLGYGGGYILDYVSHQVFDSDLVPVCRMPSDISYLKWYDGYFYGISFAGVFCKYLPTETDGNGVLRNLAPATDRMNPQFGLYGITSSGIMVGDYMYYISVSGSSITVNAVALGGEDFGTASSWTIDQIASRYLDDGWLTYYNGYLYLTSYTKGLFGDTASSGNAGISYFAVDGLVFDKDSYGFVDLGSGYTTLTSAFVIYNGHGYVLTSRDSSQAKLVSFNIGENGEPVKDDEVSSAATHGGIVISVGDLTDDGGCIRVYLLAYSGSRPYVFEDVHTVVDGKDVWTLGNYNIKLTDQNYGSQGVRFGQNGQMVYFNDSGAIYCYVAPRGNSYTFEFVSDRGDSETFMAYGSTPAEALASLGSDIVSLDVLKKIDTVFERPADGTKLFVWKHNLADYSWVEIDGLRSSEYNTDHIYRITYTLPPVYTVVFESDGVIVSSLELEEGAPIILPDDPVKAADAQYTYMFKGWSGYAAGMNATSDMTFVAEFEQTLNRYTVVFKNGETELQRAEVDYGEIPAYMGATPVKEADSQYTYTFKGWDSEIIAVSDDAIYRAVFDRHFIITVSEAEYDLVSGMLEISGTSSADIIHFAVFLGEGKVGSEGFAVPSDGVFSAKMKIENLAAGTYVLKAWDASAYTVATKGFTVSVPAYVLTFPEEVTVRNGDALVTSGDSFVAGTELTVTVESRTGYSSELNVELVNGSFVMPSEDLILTVTYTANTYTVVFKNGETELQRTEITFGDIPVYMGATPVKEADSQYTYTFKGWDPEIVAVSDDAVYTAEFLATPNGSGGSGTSTEAISITSAVYDAKRSGLELAGESSLALVHFKVFQGERSVSNEGFASVTDGKYSTFIRIEGLPAGIYVLKVWGSSLEAMATMAFRVGEPSGTETVVPSGTGDVVTVTPSEIEASIEVLPENGTLKIEATGSTGIVISKSDVEKLKDKGASLEIVLSDGSVLLDKDVLSDIAGKDGSDVRLFLKAADTSTVDGKVKELIKGSPVYDTSLSVGGTDVPVLNGATTVTVDYVLRGGDDPAKLSVWCLSDDGKVEDLACVYNGDGTVTFSTSRLHMYAVVYDIAVPGDDPVPGPTPGPEPEPSEDGGDNGMAMYIAIGVVIAVIVLAGAFFMVRKKA
ncbi:MAG: leucine-rich repeat protein [archaeon]|nr:leucine-rich repeat protein [archaeon]